VASYILIEYNYFGAGEPVVVNRPFWVPCQSLERLKTFAPTKKLLWLLLGLPPVPDFPGCPGFVLFCPVSWQDQPRDTKYPGFQGTVKMMKIITITIVGKLGHKLADQSDDDREISFLFQRLSVLIQWYNAILLHDCFVNEEE